MKRIAVFLSKNGADLQCIIDACADHIVRGSVDLVVSSSEDNLGLRRARDSGIEAIYYDPNRFHNPEEFYVKCCDRIRTKGIDWIFLLEYDNPIPGFMIREFYPRILASTPSLETEFVGVPDAGIRSAKKALEEKAKETGSMIFVVQTGPDQMGRLLSVERVPIFESDNAWKLYHRVKKTEHYAIPKILAGCCAPDDDKTGEEKS